MTNNLFNIIKNKKGTFLIVAGIILGILLLLTETTSNPHPQNLLTTTETAEEYVDNLEKKLEELINKINGVSDAKVLITLKSGCEYVYASDSTAENEKHVIVEDGLVCVKEYMPTIEGVAVVCTGGNSPAVKAKITELLRSVLGIYSTRVYITE